MKPLSVEEQYARQFHELYEKYAPDFGYETRKGTKEFDPNSPNGKLMIKVCNKLINHQTKLARVDEVENDKIISPLIGGPIVYTSEQLRNLVKLTKRDRLKQLQGEIECLTN